jgi:hypothetical protein
MWAGSQRSTPSKEHKLTLKSEIGTAESGAALVGVLALGTKTKAACKKTWATLADTSQLTAIWD